MANELKEKLNTLEAIAKGIEKKYGEGSIARLGSKKITPIRTVPSGMMSLDSYVIGCGGFPRGGVTEIFGHESSGKTTLALTATAKAQAAGGTAAYIDAENVLDLGYAKKLGVDTENLYLSQPDYGEQALAITEDLIASKAVDIIVIDSVAALIPKAELDGEMEDQNIGLHARLMSKAMRRLCAVTRQTGTCVLFLNQIREKIGVMYGNPETTTGGRALRFYASLRLEVKRIGKLVEEDGRPHSCTVKIKAVKNKVGIPFRDTEVEMIFGQGFDGFKAAIDLGAQLGVLERAGAWYSFGGEKIGMGIENTALYIKDTPELSAKIQTAIRKALQPAS